jgi:PEP-CTERM motif
MFFWSISEKKERFLLKSNYIAKVAGSLQMRNTIKTVTIAAAAAAALTISEASSAQAATLGFADVVLDFFDSGAGPLSGPYGGEFPGGIGSPVPVSTDVVLGDDPNPIADFLSLPTGSFVTLGFTDETVIDGVGNDIFIQEVGAAGERAEVFVSSDLLNFTLLGIAQDNISTAFDLASIGFTAPVQAIKIVGLDSLGASPGFDVVNVQVLPGSIGEPPHQSVPEPTSVLGLFGLSFVGMGSLLNKKLVRS